MTPPSPERTLITAACAYEVAALVTRKYPPISGLCHQNRYFHLALLAVWLLHVHRYQAELKERA